MPSQAGPGERCRGIGDCYECAYSHSQNVPSSPSNRNTNSMDGARRSLATAVTTVLRRSRRAQAIHRPFHRPRRRPQASLSAPRVKSISVATKIRGQSCESYPPRNHLGLHAGGVGGLEGVPYARKVNRAACSVGRKVLGGPKKARWV